MSVEQNMLMYRRMKEKENKITTTTSEVKKSIDKFHYVINKMKDIDRKEFTYELVENFAKEAGVDTELIFDIFKESLKKNAIDELKKKLQSDEAYNYYKLDMIAKKYGFSYSELKDLL